MWVYVALIKKHTIYPHRLYPCPIGCEVTEVHIFHKIQHTDDVFSSDEIGPGIIFTHGLEVVGIIEFGQRSPLVGEWSTDEWLLLERGIDL